MKCFFSSFFAYTLQNPNEREISSPHSHVQTGKQSDPQSVVYRLLSKRICRRPDVKGLWFVSVCWKDLFQLRGSYLFFWISWEGQKNSSLSTKSDSKENSSDTNVSSLKSVLTDFWAIWDQQNLQIYHHLIKLLWQASHVHGRLMRARRLNQNSYRPQSQNEKQKDAKVGAKGVAELGNHFPVGSADMSGPFHISMSNWSHC